MNKRINTPFTAEHFVAWCQSMLGQPYWYGTCVFKCTQSLLNSKSKQYPSHYGSDRTARYKSDIAAGKTCADCVGACKGYAWNNGKKKTEVPDKSANGMFDWAKKKGAEWGVISTIPDVPGIAVRFDGHVGYYVGNGYVIEWRGFNYGCVRTKLSGRKWTHWYRLPWIDYGTVELVLYIWYSSEDHLFYCQNGTFYNAVKKKYGLTREYLIEDIKSDPEINWGGPAPQ